jgi:putative glutamine amidotransferase
MAQTIKKHTAKPVIGVTGNAKIISPSWWCIKLAVCLTGGRALRISVNHAPDEKLDGLIISGGDDIHPSLYEGEISLKESYDQQRDALEIHFIQLALDNQLPLMGICRGAQLINVVCGGTLYNDIRPLRKKTSNKNTLLPTKKISLKNKSVLTQVMGVLTCNVNSLHSQAIQRLSPTLTCSATDSDGFIQAVENPDKKIIATQWHPEYLFYIKKHRALFDWLVLQSKKAN